MRKVKSLLKTVCVISLLILQFNTVEIKAAVYVPGNGFEYHNYFYQSYTTNYGVNTHSNGYTYANPYANNGIIGWCTWYAWGRAYEKGNPINLSYNGRAKTWWNNSPSFAKGQDPRPNSIAVWSNSGDGHVAYVEAVNGDTVYITEGGWNDEIDYHERLYNRYKPTNGSDNFLGYIYLTAPVSKPSSPSNLKIDANMTNITASWQPSSSATTYIIKVYNNYLCTGNDLVLNRDVGNVSSTSFSLN